MIADLYSNLRTIRLLKKVSQEEMSEKLNISQSSYGKLERGATKMSMDRLDKIASILGVTSFDIVHFDPGSASKLVAEKPSQASGSLQAYELEQKASQLEKEVQKLRQQINEREAVIARLK